MVMMLMTWLRNDISSDLVRKVRTTEYAKLFKNMQISINGHKIHGFAFFLGYGMKYVIGRKGFLQFKNGLQKRSTSLSDPMFRMT